MNIGLLASWLGVGIAIILLFNINKYITKKRGGNPGAVKQSLDIVVNLDPILVFDLLMNMAEDIDIFKISKQDKNELELIINRKMSFTRAPTVIYIKISKIEGDKSKVNIMSKPRYGNENNIKVDFGQNYENILFVKNYLSERITEK